MTKTTITFSLLVLFALSVQETHSSSLHTLSNAIATNTSEVSIFKDDNGLYVNVDLAYMPSSRSNETKMLLSLSNSETLLPFACFDFDSYNCFTHNCNETTAFPYFSYPYFEGMAALASAETYLDYSSWELKSPAYIAKACLVQPWRRRMPYGTGRGGIIGLGTEGTAHENFIGSRIFSIYLDSYGNDSKLLFKYDDSLSTSDAPLSLYPTSNWQVPLTNSSMSVGNSIFYLSGNLIFDIHADAIGFPLEIFTQIISLIESNSSIDCTSSYYKPTCNFSGDVSDLPSISITIAGAEISIPPRIYLNDSTTQNQSVVTLNFKALSPALTGENYVTYYFKNTIILDSNFMSYYYTVFDTSKNINTIKLYVQSARKGSSHVVLIIIAVIVFLAIGSCAAFDANKSRRYAPVGSREPILIGSNLPAQPTQGYIVANQPINQQPARYFPPSQQDTH